MQLSWDVIGKKSLPPVRRRPRVGPGLNHTFISNFLHPTPQLHYILLGGGQQMPKSIGVLASGVLLPELVLRHPAVPRPLGPQDDPALHPPRRRTSHQGISI